MIFIILLGSVITLAYVLMIGLFIIGWSRIKLISPDTYTNPLEISIVVAFRNEQENLSKLLESLHKQNYPKEKFEIILINDHSTDKGIEVINTYQLNNPNIKVYQLDTPETGKKRALIVGIQRAINPIIALTDADCRPSPNWLNEISKHLSKGSNLVIGPVIMKTSESFCSDIQALEYASLMAVAAGSVGLKHPVIASSANLAFRKDKLDLTEDVFKLTVSSGDDMFLLHRFKKSKKHDIAFVKSADATVFTSPANSIIQALKQRQRWASKSPKYTDIDIIIAGLIVILYNLLIVSSFITGMINSKWLLLFGGLLIVKSMFDLILLTKYLSFFDQMRLLRVFIPLQLIYPFYIVSAFLSGILSSTSWKERKIR